MKKVLLVCSLVFAVIFLSCATVPKGGSRLIITNHHYLASASSINDFTNLIIDDLLDYEDQYSDVKRIGVNKWDSSELKLAEYILQKSEGIIISFATVNSVGNIYKVYSTSGSNKYIAYLFITSVRTRPSRYTSVFNPLAEDKQMGYSGYVFQVFE